MLFTMWLNLYATRLVLNNLGVEDMGVYGVVGSIVSLFSVFSVGVTNTVQRFLTYVIGKRNGDVNKVFCTSLNMIILLSVLILILLESVGLWCLYYWVNIPQSSMMVAFWVYQFSVLSCIVSFASIPYDALILAHEKIDVYAVISIIQVVLTCAAAYCLSLFTSNRLLIYAILMAVIGVLIRVLYQMYCRIKIKESDYHFVIDRYVVKEMGSFAGVSTFSGILYMTYSQGLVLIINWLFGVALNAVYSISLQLKNAILSFAYNIIKAVSPQIIKTYANGNVEMHKLLVYSACKMQVYMIYFIFIPFLFRTKYIMGLWLGYVPDYTVAFAKVTIFMSLLCALFEPIRTAVNATGNILKFTLFPEFFYLFSLFLTYMLTLWSHNPVVFIISVVLFDTIAWGIHIYYALKVIPISLKGLSVKVFAPSVGVAIGGFSVCYLLARYTQENLVGFSCLLLVNSLVLLMLIYYVGIDSRERNLFNVLIKNMLGRYE